MVLWFSNRSDVNNYTRLPPLSILMTINYYNLFYLVILSTILGRNNSGMIGILFLGMYLQAFSSIYITM